MVSHKGRNLTSEPDGTEATSIREEGNIKQEEQHKVRRPSKLVLFQENNNNKKKHFHPPPSVASHQPLTLLSQEQIFIYLSLFLKKKEEKEKQPPLDCIALQRKVFWGSWIHTQPCVAMQTKAASASWTRGWVNGRSHPSSPSHRSECELRIGRRFFRIGRLWQHPRSRLVWISTIFQSIFHANITTLSHTFFMSAWWVITGSAHQEANPRVSLFFYTENWISLVSKKKDMFSAKKRWEAYFKFIDTHDTIIKV